MINSVLEIQLTSSRAISPEGNVVFNEQKTFPTDIDYDNSTGIITFKQTGQYSIKWWVATETTLKGTIGFHLQSSQGMFTPGCSPIKTGQVTGFGVIDVEAAGTTLSLKNKSTTNTIISRKSLTKAYLLVTPLSTATTTSPRVYRGNLSQPLSALEVPLGNSIIYKLEYASSTNLKLSLVPVNEQVVYDYRRFSAYDGGTATEGNYSDNEILTTSTTKDPMIYNNSREMHWVLLRVQNLATDLWSLYEVRFFASDGTARVTVWVNVIEEEVSY